MDIDFSFRPGEGLPFTELERIRARGPVFWSETLGGWAVSSYDLVKEVLTDTGRFTSEGTPIGEAFGAEAMLVDDTELHHAMRAVWAKHLSPSAMAERTAAFKALATRLLTPAVARLDAGETVNVAGVFEVFVIEIIGWLFAVGEDRLRDLNRWNRMFSDTPALEIPKDSPLYARHLAAKAEVFDFLHGEMADRRERLARGESPEDLVSLMVAAEGRAGVTRANAADNLMNLFLGALDTTSKWFGNALVVLGRRPDAFEAVMRDRGLISPVFLDEVMRLESVAQVIQRRVRGPDTVLAGQRLEADQSVFTFLGAANRDPAVFPDPGAFDLNRESKLNLGFGFGMHHCLGLHTARHEVVCFLNVLLDLVPDFEIVEVEYPTTWALWGPRVLTLRRAGN